MNSSLAPLFWLQVHNFMLNRIPSPLQGLGPRLLGAFAIDAASNPLVFYREPRHALFPSWAVLGRRPPAAWGANCKRAV